MVVVSDLAGLGVGFRGKRGFPWTEEVRKFFSLVGLLRLRRTELALGSWFLWLGNCSELPLVSVLLFCLSQLLSPCISGSTFLGGCTSPFS